MKEYFVWLAKFITGVCVLLVFIPVAIGVMVGTASSSLTQTTPTEKAKSVAVVELNGMIVESKEILEKLYTHIADDDVLGVVLDINSPGGAVGPSQAIFSTVQQLSNEKPIVAALGSVAASGGLYSALGAKKILTQPGTLTGSIGVILQLPNFHKIANEYGFQMITIKSGELKDVGNSFRPMTSTDRDFLQASVNKVKLDFVDAIVQGRGLERSKVESFSDGRIILGSEAVEYGLADGFGTVYDAAKEVYTLAGQPLDEGETPKLVYEEDEFAKFKELFAPKSLAQFVQQLFGLSPSQAPQAVPTF